LKAEERKILAIRKLFGEDSSSGESRIQQNYFEEEGKHPILDA
jgi:hypothetical protein